jgi:hypothetical protein
MRSKRSLNSCSGSGNHVGVAKFNDFDAQEATSKMR